MFSRVGRLGAIVLGSAPMSCAAGKSAVSAAARRLVAVSMTAVLWSAMAGSAAAAQGNLDTTFGRGGKVTTDFGQASVANAVIRQIDGKIVAAGRVGPNSDFGVARYNADGSPDTSFGGGVVITRFTNDSDVARAVAVRPDGSIVVGGIAGDPAGANSNLIGDFALAAYNRDGTLDASFGRGGRVTTDLSGGLGDGIRAMAILPEGKILAVGAAGANVALARYQPDGSLDSSFGRDGKEVVGIGNAGHAFAVAVLGDGQFLVAGNATNAQTQSDFMLARFNADGSLDKGFGSGGLVTTDFGGLNDLGFGLAVQRDGRIVVVGNTDSLDVFGVRGDLKFGIARYRGDGTLDSTFGRDGKVQINPTPLADGLRGVALEPDGRIVASGFIGDLGGSFSDPLIGDFGLVRLNTDGSLDRTFGTAGVARTDFAASGDGGRAITTDNSNRIVVAGAATTNRLNFALARYTGSDTASRRRSSLRRSRRHDHSPASHRDSRTRADVTSEHAPAARGKRLRMR
jgi:uncharacterized delta-60 repeat protein